MKLAELANAVGGALEGDGSLEITGLAGLKEADPGTLSFLANPRYSAAVAETKASAVIVTPDWKGNHACALIRVKNPDLAFARAAPLLGPKPLVAPRGVHPTAVVAASAVLGADVSVGPHCVLEDGARIGARTVLMAGCYVGHETRVGEDCRLYPHVSLRERITIGNRVILHNGAVIGSDGFGYVMDAGAWNKVPQIGTVEVGDDVEIGANTTVDRARFGKTVIGRGVKVDNLVQIAHNVRIGDHTAIAAQTGISGSSTIGKYAMLGGQSGVVGHLTVGDRCIVGAQSGVTKDVPPGTYVMGFPAAPHQEQARNYAGVQRLPELKERVKTIEKRLASLETALQGGKAGSNP